MRAENEAFVQALMAKHVGAAFDRDQSHLVDARLNSLARGANLENADALVKRLRSAPSVALLDSVIEALTTHETLFFRDGAPFRTLESQVLPALLTARAAKRRLRIWSAGCSTGQEPYSVAILLRERFPGLEGWSISILGTDVSKSTLERARDGRYSEMELRRGLTRAARDKFFVREGDDYRLCESIRRMVSWEPRNLAADWPPMLPCDLVLMRNVLIYLEPQARRRVLERVSEVLAPDGYLLLGTSETTFGVCSQLEPCTLEGATLYRKNRK